MAVNNILFLVGIGAPTEIYQPLLQQLQQCYSLAKITSLNWWQQADFGRQDIETALQDRQTVLVGHSAGGVVALQAWQRWSQLVQKIVMLDSHIIYRASKLPSIDKMLSVMLEGDNETLKQIISQAYAPVKSNDTQFYSAFTTLVQWVNSDFELVAAKIKQKPAFALHVGFTDTNYKKYNDDTIQQEQTIWGKYGVDVRCLPMNHFDLIESQHAREISKVIADWC